MQVNQQNHHQPQVSRYSDCDQAGLNALLKRYDLTVKVVGYGEPIPGSYWGDEEAGLIGSVLYLRPDTPVHSILHEACHYICMDPDRRKNLDTNAEGDYDEENAVCYLQITLADHMNDMDKQKMCDDMDSWGYTFRLGSAQRWYQDDAQDAREWLIHYGILGADNQVTFQLRHQI